MRDRRPIRRRGGRLALFASLLLIAPPALAQESAASSVTLPIRMPVGLLYDVLRDAFPVETDRESTWSDWTALPDGSRIRTQVYLHRGPATIEAVASALDVRFDDVQYRLRAEVARSSGGVATGSCGQGDEWPHRARIAARSDLAWSQDWTLSSRTTFAPPELGSPCRLDDGTDLVPVLRSILGERLPAAASSIDETIARSGVERHRFADLWRALSAPIEPVPGIWLSLRPRDAVAGPIAGAGDVVEAAIGLTLEPEVTLGAAAPEEEAVPAPALRLAAVPEPRVALETPIVASYDEVSERLSSQLVGAELPVVGRGGLRIESVRAYRGGDRVTCEMGVGGLLDGTAFVTALPALSTDGTMLLLGDVETRIESPGRFKRALAGMAEKPLAAAVEQNGQIDLRARLAHVRNGLLQAFNREVAPGTWLQGEIANVRAAGIRVLDSGIEARLLFDAEVRVELR